VNCAVHLVNPSTLLLRLKCGLEDSQTSLTFTLSVAKPCICLTGQQRNLGAEEQLQSFWGTGRAIGFSGC
jgi:hypothetical protein